MSSFCWEVGIHGKLVLVLDHCSMLLRKQVWFTFLQPIVNRHGVKGTYWPQKKYCESLHVLETEFNSFQHWPAWRTVSDSAPRSHRSLNAVVDVTLLWRLQQQKSPPFSHSGASVMSETTTPERQVSLGGACKNGGCIGGGDRGERGT